MITITRMTKTEPAYIPPNWSNGTDAGIAKALQKHYEDVIDLSEYWSIGDERMIHLNAMQAASPNGSITLPEQDITVVITAFNHNDLETPINGHTKGCITVQTKECLHNLTGNLDTNGHIYIDGESSQDPTFTKWSELYMRTYLNGIVLNAFHPTFKSMIKPSKHYRHTTYNGSASEEVIDNIFLPSYPEVFGTESYSFYVPTDSAEGTQWEYYSNGDNSRLIKYGNNGGQPNNKVQSWWTGSASSYYQSYTGYAWVCVASDGTAGRYIGDYALALAPAFVL